MHRRRYGLWRRCPKPAWGSSPGPPTGSPRRPPRRRRGWRHIRHRPARSHRRHRRPIPAALLGGLGLSDIQRRDRPGLVHRSAAPDGVQLVALGDLTGAVAIAGIRVVASTADRQGLAIEDLHQPRRDQFAVPLRQSPHQDAHGQAPEPSAQSRGRGQTGKAQRRGRPVSWITGPGGRSIVKRGPQVDQDQDVGLEGDVDLADRRADRHDDVIRLRPEFQFHSCPRITVISTPIDTILGKNLFSHMGLRRIWNKLIVRGQHPGRYDVDEIRAEPFPSGHPSRSWGQLVRQPDGRVEDEPWPWPDR